MAICRFYQQGYCKFGDSCRFEHPGANRQPQSTNRFGALSGGTSSAMGRQQEHPYNLSKEVIQRDLSEERPAWILSAYGPGRDAPEQLFGGYPREQSPEEIRLHYMQGLMAGNPQAAINEIDGLNQTAQQQIQAALANLDGAIQFVVDAGNKHPNRRDICQQGTVPGGTTGEFAVGKPRNPAFGGGQATAFGAPANAFGAPSQPANAFSSPSQPSQPSAGGFGQPSALGQKPNPFGTPAFGQPAKPAATPAFGQASQPVSAFGQSSALGAKPSAFGAPAFGQPAQPAAAPAFGQPSSTPAFGQPSQPGTAFGQSSGLGQKPNPWGAPAGGSTASPFANTAAQQPAAQNPFGAAPQQQQNASPFGQAPPAQPAANPFGQQAPAQPSAFGQQQQAQSNAFGQKQPSQPSPFGQQQPAQANPFGSKPAANNAMDTSSTPAAQNPFAASKPAASNPFGSAAPASSPFTQQPAVSAPANAPTGPSAASAPSNPYPPTASRQHPPITAYSTRGPQGELTSFQGQPVTYQLPVGRGGENKKPVPMVRKPDGSLAKVWFPDGAPGYTPDTEAADQSLYQKQEVVDSWKTFVAHGQFVDGVMPEVPPRREWCAWDF
ncbi:hypothetical protein CONLIGDRAFT_683672 [Coniochaeta ligniaria NRRL 30616]|uniref:C3H1-type domain-containing protein n=1 Tax=Coniochaeta ligniaria NRRL 30616 TaxID=1408157 RepID=A0A1J7IGY1_9PEZI|nr:hypothetical protein CONLIGDRAFT_683672 [Coniochaeta ligniaria NRRL 30616]